MRVSQRFKLQGCRFVPTTRNTWRVVTSQIPRKFYRERERGKKELKAHRIMKAQLEAKAQRERDKVEREREEEIQKELENEMRLKYQTF